MAGWASVDRLASGQLLYKWSPVWPGLGLDLNLNLDLDLDLTANFSHRRTEAPSDRASSSSGSGVDQELWSHIGMQSMPFDFISLEMVFACVMSDIAAWHEERKTFSLCSSWFAYRPVPGKKNLFSSLGTHLACVLFSFSIERWKRSYRKCPNTVMGREMGDFDDGDEDGRVDGDAI